MAAEIRSAQARDVAVNAYLFLYPLVTMEVTRLQATNMGCEAVNTFLHMREFPSAEFKAVVRPNFDTLYSSAWLDLTGGPAVVSTRADPDGRYYQLPMYDMWTDAFAAPGQRTTGTAAGAWAVVPAGWRGNLPDGVDRIDAPTPHVWVIGRVQTNGPEDYPVVHQVQDAFSITPLAHSGGQARAATVGIDPTVDMETPPLDQVNGMSAEDFFSRSLILMRMHPPHLTDWSLIAQMRRLGMAAGARFADLERGVRELLRDVPDTARQVMQQALPRMGKNVNGWQIDTGTMGVYGNDYLKRAIVAMAGLGALVPEDAIYPLLLADAEGRQVTGDHDYVLHFGPDELPPVHAFWSVTIYDAEGFPAANPLNRFAIGDRDPLRYNADGSLDLYLQHESPGTDREANWLPAPRGPLGITMRLYSPQATVLNGTWTPPPVRRT